MVEPTDKPKLGREEGAVLRDLLKKPNGKEKLYAVIKALSALRLTKEDPTPSLVLALDDNQLSMSTEKGPNDFLYQGSVGAAFNATTLKQFGITHILTCASGIGQRFPDQFVYL